MALIECHQCGRTVSDNAPRCPACGYPITPARETAGGSITDLAPSMAPRSTRADPGSSLWSPRATGVEIAAAGWWALLGATSGAAAIGMAGVAMALDATWAGLSGLAAGVIALVLAAHAMRIARRGAAVRPGMGRVQRRRAMAHAVREHAPLAAWGVAMGAAALLAILILLIV